MAVHRYKTEFKEKAVLRLIDAVDDYPFTWSAIKTISSDIGCSPQTLHSWYKKYLEEPKLYSQEIQKNKEDSKSKRDDKTKKICNDKFNIQNFRNSRVNINFPVSLRALIFQIPLLLARLLFILLTIFQTFILYNTWESGNNIAEGIPAVMFIGLFGYGLIRFLMGSPKPTEDKYRECSIYFNISFGIPFILTILIVLYRCTGQILVGNEYTFIS